MHYQSLFHPYGCLPLGALKGGNGMLELQSTSHDEPHGQSPYQLLVSPAARHSF